MSQDTEHLKALHETLNESAKAGKTAHINPPEARHSADALRRVLDDSFDKEAQQNKAG